MYIGGINIFLCVNEYKQYLVVHCQQEIHLYVVQPSIAIAFLRCSLTKIQMELQEWPGARGSQFEIIGTEQTVGT